MGHVRSGFEAVSPCTIDAVADEPVEAVTRIGLPYMRKIRVQMPGNPLLQRGLCKRLKLVLTNREHTSRFCSVQHDLRRIIRGSERINLGWDPKLTYWCVVL